MAGYTFIDPQDNDRNGERPNDPKTFRDLLAIIFGCSPEDCDCVFSVFGKECHGHDWLKKFTRDEKCALPTCTEDCLVTGKPFPGIEIKHKEVRCDFSKISDIKDQLRHAIAMAVCAKAHKGMREKGAAIDAKSPDEKILLMIAAEYVGLKITNPDPAIKAQLEDLKQQVGADAVWQGFVDTMNKKNLRDIFQRQVSPEAQEYLANSNIDTDDYLKMTKELIEEQNADPDHIMSKFNLSADATDDVLKAMDVEGLTELDENQNRIFRYDAQGKLKEGPA